MNRRGGFILLAIDSFLNLRLHLSEGILWTALTLNYIQRFLLTVVFSFVSMRLEEPNNDYGFTTNRAKTKTSG